jgi:hypothetical protein
MMMGFHGSTAKQSGLTKPISKPSSGRIALAAERRSTNATPVVADPTTWDNVAADEAEAEIRARIESMHIKMQHDGGQKDTQPSSMPFVDSLRRETRKSQEDFEVPEELVESGVTGGLDEQPLTEMSSISNNNPRRSSLPIKKTTKTGNVKPGQKGPQQLQQQDSNINGPAGSMRRMLPEHERLAMLAGLKANHASMMSVYQRLPMNTDTPAKIQRYICNSVE